VSRRKIFVDVALGGVVSTPEAEEKEMEQV
jgi:hypothetical protein